MNDDDRNLFESINTLREAAYSSFNDRRVYEWKLNIAIWTALAIVIAGLLQPSKAGDVLRLGTSAWTWSAILGSLLIYVHIYWSHGAAKANAIDKGIAIHYSKAMQKLVALPFHDELNNQIEQHPKHVGWHQWSHLAQIAITANLVIAVVILIYTRAA